MNFFQVKHFPKSIFHSRKVQIVGIILLVGMMVTIGIVNIPHSSGTTWYVSTPYFAPNDSFLHAQVSVKDPSIIFFEENWHVFFTGIQYDEENIPIRSINYVSAPTLKELNDAPRFNITPFSNNTKRTAAPHIFYFEPDQKWYLIAQAEYEDRYTPIYSTTTNISDPSSWSNVQCLVEKFEPDKWIDFWVICDNSTSYLFYTRNHGDMYFMTTPINSFPHGFGTPTKVDANIKVHEACMVYKIRDSQEYWLLTENQYSGNHREYYLSKASALDGKWSDSELFATGNDLQFSDPQNQWTTVVSSGEFIRFGYDQIMEIASGEKIEFFFFFSPRVKIVQYSNTEWRLGIIRDFSEESEGQIYLNEQKN